MVAEFGNYLLSLALAIAIAQSVIPIISNFSEGSAGTMAACKNASAAQFIITLLAFITLITLYINSDFSVLNVFLNSHSAVPLVYKITGTWGNHEGSMLLWVLVLSLFGVVVGIFSYNIPRKLHLTALGIQGCISSAFLLFTLTMSNPFQRLFPQPLEGRDLNPILQDISMIIHPPLLYLGYAGFSVAFSFSIAALLHGNKENGRNWAIMLRSWTITAWIALTLGIASGSFWAYYELGWGGWWFWDPVENASFMPWLSGTALLHSAIATEKRNAITSWTILLSILTFSLSLFGLFLVRSGILSSVHSFATDPHRGAFILAILTIFTCGAILLYSSRIHLLRAPYAFKTISKESVMILNNIVLVVACCSVLLGTLFPLIVEAISQEKISVGAPYFNLVVGSMMLLLMLFVPLGPLLAWRQSNLADVKKKVTSVFVVAVTSGIAVFFLVPELTLAGAFIIAISVWLMLGTVLEPIGRSINPLNRNSYTLPAVLKELYNLPVASWSKVFAHFGLGVTLLGIVFSSNFEQEQMLKMLIGDNTSISDYKITLDEIKRQSGANFFEDTGTLTVRKDRHIVAKLKPSKRFFTVRQTATTEAALVNFGLSQLYVSIGEILDDDSATLRIYYKPLILLIWLGAVLMAAGGALALFKNTKNGATHSNGITNDSLQGK